jgi:hypothetical protein
VADLLQLMAYWLKPRVKTTMPAPEKSDSCSTCSAGWRLPLLLGIVLASILLGSSDRIRQAVFQPLRKQPAVEEGVRSANKVLLTVNFGNGQLVHETADWREGMTVADALQNNRSISFLTEGSGNSAFLTSLNGVMNEGAGSRNWTYTVNGKYADRSFAIYELRPNDHVLWTFTVQK